jgi:pre-rRNA-processing protein TSR3
MQIFPPTIVLRHQRENLKKCSLRGLESRADFKFYTYPKSLLPEINNYILLSLEAPPLSLEDKELGLFVLDSTWRYAEKMMHWVEPKGTFIKRSIPSNFRTAYPRRQDDCIDPERGLASIEAIYIAYHLMGRETTGLLDLYHWKDEFLDMNNLKS